MSGTNPIQGSSNFSNADGIGDKNTPPTKKNTNIEIAVGRKGFFKKNQMGKMRALKGKITSFFKSLGRRNTNKKTDKIFKHRLSIDLKEEVEESESEEEYILIRKQATQKSGTLVEAKVGRVVGKTLEKLTWHVKRAEKKMTGGDTNLLENAKFIGKGRDKLVLNSAALQAEGKVLIIARRFRSLPFLKELKIMRELGLFDQPAEGVEEALGYEEVKDKNGKVIGFTMPRGEDLEKFLSKTPEEPPTIQQRMKYISDVVEKISDLNGKGIVHCDLKLDNLLKVEGKEEVQVIDVGRARNLEKKKSKRLHGGGNDRMNIYYEPVNDKFDSPALAMVMMNIIGKAKFTVENDLKILTTGIEADEELTAEEFVVRVDSFRAIDKKSPRRSLKKFVQETLIRAGLKKEYRGDQQALIRFFIEAFIKSHRKEIDGAYEKDNEKTPADDLKEILLGLTKEELSERWTTTDAWKELQKIINR